MGPGNAQRVEEGSARHAAVGRSQHAAKFLKAQGFENVANLTGGLRALGMAV